MENKLDLIADNSEDMKVSGRKLHMFLDVATRYNDWFSRMLEYGFEEGKDFYSKMSKSENGFGRPQIDHEMTIDIAKEISMLQRTEKGKQARRYFIQLEKDWNSPEKVMARALDIAHKTLAEVRVSLDEANKVIEEQKPKVVFADAVSTSKSSVLIGELAKIIKQNGVDVGQRRLFQWLRDNGYLMKSGSSKNMPTQRAMEMKLFEIKEGSYTNGDGVNITTKTSKVTGKGQIYFVNKLLANGKVLLN